MIAPTVSGVAPSVERHSAALRCGPSSPARRAIRRAQVKKARRIHKTPFVSFPLFPFFLFLSPPSAFSAHSRTLRVSGPAVRIFSRRSGFRGFSTKSTILRTNLRTKPPDQSMEGQSMEDGINDGGGSKRRGPRTAALHRGTRCLFEMATKPGQCEAHFQYVQEAPSKRGQTCE